MYLLTLFFDSQHQGGTLMWIIFATGIIASYIGLDKALFLHRLRKYRKRFNNNFSYISEGKEIKKIGFDEYDTLLLQLQSCINNRNLGQKGYFREFLICTVPLIERHLSTMSAWVSVAPLLGLLGTVVGMVQTFRVIMDFGVGNPALTAEGISVALLTTQAGLIVAFPVMLFHNYLGNKKNNLISSIINDFEEINSKFFTIKTAG